MKNILTIDIGGTKTAYAVFNESAEILKYFSFPTEPRRGEKKLFEYIKSRVNVYNDIDFVSISCPGPLDLKTGRTINIVTMGWKDVPVRQSAEEIFNAKALLNNDCDAAAVGEHIYGAGKGADNLVYITLSTGIGGGIIINGRLYSGESAAAEFGHIPIPWDEKRVCGCGGVNCSELYGSGTAMQNFYKEKTGLNLTAKEIVKAGLAGDKTAVSALERAGRAVSYVLKTVDKIIDPEVIVLGGGLSNDLEILLNYIDFNKKEKLKKYQLDGKQGLYGAFHLAAHL